MAAALIKSRNVTRLFSSRNTLRCLLHLDSFHVRRSRRGYSTHLLWSSKVECFGKLRICSEVGLHVKPANALEGRQDIVSVYLTMNSPNFPRGIEDEFKKVLECAVSDSNDEAEYSLVTVNINMFVWLFIYSFIHPSIHPSIHPFFRSFFHLFIYLFIYLFVYFFFIITNYCVINCYYLKTPFRIRCKIHPCNK